MGGLGEMRMAAFLGPPSHLSGARSFQSWAGADSILELRPTAAPKNANWSLIKAKIERVSGEAERLARFRTARSPHSPPIGDVGQPVSVARTARRVRRATALRSLAG